MRSICLIILCALATTAGAAETWVRCGASVDVAEGRLTGALTLVVVDDAIDRVLDGHPGAGNDAEIVDVSEMTCLPGLMDMHTHLTS
ncbi:MAG: hypothetical protein WDZ60_02025, partial [Wenzhouxiangellaceae bacterium]